MVDWFSKRPEGQTRPGRGAVHPSVSEIQHDLLVGEYPRHEDIEWLAQAHRVTAVLNLQDHDDLRMHGLDLRAMRSTYHDHGIRLVHSPIPDGSADEMANRLEVALNDLHALIGGGSRRVYLHCNAGLNRAPTLAIAYLRAHRGMSLDEAMAHVKARRACGPFMTVLEDYFGPRDYKPGT
jgi:atypical dual specificity phosphatase